MSILFDVVLALLALALCWQGTRNLALATPEVKQLGLDFQLLHRLVRYCNIIGWATWYLVLASSAGLDPGYQIDWPRSTFIWNLGWYLISVHLHARAWRHRSHGSSSSTNFTGLSSDLVFRARERLRDVRYELRLLWEDAESRQTILLVIIIALVLRAELGAGVRWVVALISQYIDNPTVVLSVVLAGVWTLGAITAGSISRRILTYHMGVITSPLYVGTRVPRW